MTGRFARDERGVALGLAVILVAVIAVMSAGLLTFVAADLDALMEVNRGQQAFELAESGIEVAKAHLADDPSSSEWSCGELCLEGMGENAVSVITEYETKGRLSGPLRPVSTAARSAGSKRSTRSRMASPLP